MSHVNLQVTVIQQCNDWYVHNLYGTLIITLFTQGVHDLKPKTLSNYCTNKTVKSNLLYYML